jgi:predicted outer membrane repeat protein
MRRKLMTALMAGTLICLAALAGPQPTSATEDTFYISADTIAFGGSCNDPDVLYNPMNGLEPSLLAVYGDEDFGTGDTIILCDNGVGIDYVFESDTPSQDIASKEITITGESGQEVVLDANGFDPFIFANGPLNIENLVIQDAGTAITMSGTPTLNVTDVTFEDGADVDDIVTGQSIDSSGIVSVVGSTFTHNYSSGSGGAIYVSNAVSVTITDSRFDGNTSGNSGGAIYAASIENLTIESNQFQRNTAAGQGGAIRVQWGTGGTSITRNTFTENSAEQGGAVSINDGEVDSYLWSVSRNTFTKNRATLNGGALHMALDNSGNVVTPNVKRNRFRGNSAPAAGAVVVESDYGTERAILKRYERGLRGNSFQANRGTRDRRSANIGVHFD